MKKKMQVAVIAVVMSTSCLVEAGQDKDIQSLVSEAAFLDEVVVTATRTKNTFSRTSSNIAVVNSDDINKMDAKDLVSVLKKIPGVYFTNASGLEPKISMRGTHIGMSGGALVLLNGIPVNMGKFGYTDFKSLPVENIQRVEVIKGPMSFLYGGDSARGVINIITKRGNESFAGKVSVTGGSYSDQRYNALAYGANENMDYNINVKKRVQDGYRDDTAIDVNAINGEIGTFIFEDARLSFYFNGTDTERQLAKSLTKDQRDEDPRQALDYSDTETTDIITGLNFDLEKDGYDIKTTIYYKNRDKSYENYKRATRRPYREELQEDILGVRAIYSCKQPVAGFKNIFSAGFDYDHDKIDLTTVRVASTAPDLPYTVPDLRKSGDFTRQELGLFMQDEFHPTNSLSVTVGLRWDYFELDNRADYDFSQGGTLPYDKKTDFDKLNPRLALSYLVKDDLSIYTSYSKAYRAPNIYDYYASGSTSASNAYTLEPETFSQVELGSRYGYSQWLNIDMSLFHIVIEDMLDTAYDSSGTYMGKQNISEVTLKGFELALSGKPLTWLEYQFGYSYTDARYSADFLDKSLVNVNGNRVTKVPYNKVNLDLDFSLYDAKNYALLWHVNLYYQSEFEMDKLNSAQYKDYALLNTKLRLVHNDFEVFVAVDNVADVDYDGYAFRSSGLDYYYPAAGTTFASGVSYVF